MSDTPEDLSESPDISTGAADAGPESTHGEPLPRDRADVDPDDEEADRDQ